MVITQVTFSCNIINVEQNQIIAECCYQFIYKELSHKFFSVIMSSQTTVRGIKPVWNCNSHKRPILENENR